MIAYCKVLFQHSPEDTEEDYSKPQSYLPSGLESSAEPPEYDAVLSTISRGIRYAGRAWLIV
jgi:hypothetical protein